MTTFKITIESDNDAKLLKQMLESLKFVKKIEEIKHKSASTQSSTLKPMKIEEFIERYKESEQDIEKGNLILQEDAKKYFSRKHDKKGKLTKPAY